MMMNEVVCGSLGQQRHCPLTNSIDSYHFGPLKNGKAIVRTKRRILLSIPSSCFLDYYRKGDNGKYP